MDKIKFGTSGWRAIIADDFTFQNVKVVVSAIAQYLKEKRLLAKPVIIGSDPRFLSEEFVKTAAGVLAAQLIESIVCPGATPTPVISYAILSKKLAGGINFTASHNPPNYQGIKFSPEWGGPALPDVTQKIESEANSLIERGSTIEELDFEKALQKGLVKFYDPHKDYLKRLKELLLVNEIKKSKLKIGLDLLYGAGIGYLDAFLNEYLKPVFVLNNHRDVLFGGKSPEPSEGNLAVLKQELKKHKCNLGLSVDGDADRFGIIDTDGSFIQPNEFLAMVLRHLLKTRKWKGVIARSVMTSHFVDAVAARHGITVRETPVGFKYIGEVMAAEDFIVGGEESGGLTIKGHIPEKDGILACLLAAEIMAVEKKSLKAVINDMRKEFGTFLTNRINIRVSEDSFESLRQNLSLHPPTSIGDYHVKRIVETDGYKFILKENSWVGVRFSGTEPVLRIYVETDNEKKLAELTELSKKLFAGGEKKKKK